MIKKRLSFAKAHRNWTLEDWCRVLLSDQSSVQQFHVRTLVQEAGMQGVQLHPKNF